MTTTITQPQTQTRMHEAAGPTDPSPEESGALDQAKKWGQVARRAHDNCSNVDAKEQLEQRRQTSAQ